MAGMERISTHWGRVINLFASETRHDLDKFHLNYFNHYSRPDFGPIINGQFGIFMTQEPFKQTPPSAISTGQHLTSSPPASPLHEGPCLSLGEGLQEQLRRLQQCVSELLIKNQQLRMLLESANESSSQVASPLNAPRTCEESNPRRGH
jgi:hypothetical protein